MINICNKCGQNGCHHIDPRLAMQMADRYAREMEHRRQELIRGGMAPDMMHNPHRYIAPDPGQLRPFIAEPEPNKKLLLLRRAK